MCEGVDGGAPWLRTEDREFVAIGVVGVIGGVLGLWVDNREIVVGVICVDKGAVEVEADGVESIDEVVAVVLEVWKGITNQW